MTKALRVPRTDVLAAVAEGHRTARDVAEWLGMAVPSASAALSRARREGAVVVVDREGPRGLGPLPAEPVVARGYAIVPPAQLVSALEWIRYVE